jgi:hypothetical protein
MWKSETKVDFITGQNKEDLNRVFSRYIGASRETTELRFLKKYYWATISEENENY